jgi:uncharacterized protein
MMRNRTRGRILAREHKLCNTLWSQARGLMFSRKRALVMDFGSSRRIGLHMMFVFFPIDALYADEKKRVVEIKRNFYPFTLYTPQRKARYVIELPHPDGSGTVIKDQLEF